MNLLLDLEILGWLLVGLGGMLVVPAIAALGFGEPVFPYLASAATALIFGLPLALSSRGRDRRLRSRDAFLVVSGAWGLASVAGGLPYVFSGVLSPVDALFEAASGFTTTGSTVMADVEAVPQALLLWRSFTQWLGGMGIIVFTIAILPLLGIGGMQLFKAEVPGPITDKLTPRVADTARRLWLVYVGFTVAAAVLLRICGMGWFDAVCHSFTTLATGGFSTRNASLGAFSPAAQWVVIVFMLIAGGNFVLHYQAVTGRLRQALADHELRFFAAIVAVLCLAMGFAVRSFDLADPVRTVVFQVVSLLTTTGYATADYDTWPRLAHLIVLPLMILGGMAGSTAGGLKALRVLLGFHALRASLARILHPHAVRPVHFNGRPVSDEVVSGVGVFVLAYAVVAFVGAAAVGAAGYDLPTSLTASLTALGNVGPGLGAVGPTHTFAHLPGLPKLVLSFSMIAGRLEIFTLLVLLSPSFWRR